jgi:hypothetical protein
MQQHPEQQSRNASGTFFRLLGIPTILWLGSDSDNSSWAHISSLDLDLDLGLIQVGCCNFAGMTRGLRLCASSDDVECAATCSTPEERPLPTLAF